MTTEDDVQILSDLYKQLRELDAIEVHIKELTDREVLSRTIDSRLFSEADLMKRENLVQVAHSPSSPRLDAIRQSLREIINIRSRQSIRSLTVLDLSDEIFVQIFEYVKGREVRKNYHTESSPGHMYIKDVRLTCKRFCGASSHLLIHSLKLRVDPESVSYLNNICSHSSISRGLECIRISLDFYADDMANGIHFFTFYQWEWLRNHIMSRNESFGLPDFYESPGQRHQAEQDVIEMKNIEKAWSSCLEPLDSSDPADSDDFAVFNARLREGLADKSSWPYYSVLENAYKMYHHLHCKQQTLLDDGNHGIFAKAISTAFSRIPTLRRLEIGERHRSSEDLDAWLGDVMDHAKLMRYMVQSNSWEQARHSGLEIPNDILRLPISIPIAIHQAGPYNWLNSLEIRLNTLPDTIHYLSLEDHEITALRALTQRLQYFDLSPIGTPLIGPPEFPEEVFGGMNYLRIYLNALIDSDSLHRISISLNKEYRLFNGDRPPTSDMGLLVSQRRWPKLQDINLDGMPLQLEDIKLFAEGASVSLNRFSLKNCYLLSGTWEEVLDILREHARGREWDLECPYGAECIDMSPVVYDRIFKKDYLDWNRPFPAGLYIQGRKTENPFREPEPEPESDSEDESQEEPEEESVSEDD